jgi:hypothetical protein
MTYSAEFGVSVGQWEYVHLTIDGQEFADHFLGKDQDMEVLLGDYHASLRVAVLHGRDEAVSAVKAPNLPDTAGLIMSELKAKVVKVIEHETPGLEVADKPWRRPVKAAEPKALESGTPVVQKAVTTGLEDF